MRPVPAAAVDLIKRFEQGPNGGFAAQRYNDPAGNPTIGWGHLLHPGDPLWNATINEQTAEQLAEQDLDAASTQLWIQLGPATVNKLSDGQWAALLDFVFNEGIGHFKASTLCHLVLNGDFTAAADEFPKWIYSGNPPRALAGLVTRRGAERALWTS